MAFLTVDIRFIASAYIPGSAKKETALLIRSLWLKAPVAGSSKRQIDDIPGSNQPCGVSRTEGAFNA